jgi:hypothetical protein
MLTAQGTYAMLGKQGLWATVVLSHEVLSAASVPHVVIGGVAVCLHGYQRNTIDVDLLVRSEDSARIKGTLNGAGLRRAENREFLSPDGIPVQFVMASESAGADRSLGVRMPDPGDPESWTNIEDIPVLTLSKLIESKLACGLGNMRRTHRDFADVVELIVIHNLSRSFARHLHKSLRKTYRELVLRSRGEV